MNWADMAWDRHTWQAVMNLGVPKKGGEFLD